MQELSGITIVRQTEMASIQRLEDKGYLIRVGLKKGRGGWSVYELPENIFTGMLRLETDNKLVAQYAMVRIRPIILKKPKSF
jgi:hypothetical protein